jgi:hypothetical protein
MEEIDLTKPFTSSEIVKTFDRHKNYVVQKGEKRYDYCTLTDNATHNGGLHFRCSRTLHPTRTTPAHDTLINLTFEKLGYNDAKKDHEYKVADHENYKIYVTDGVEMGGRRRKSRKSKKSKRSKKSRKSRK